MSDLRTLLTALNQLELMPGAHDRVAKLIRTAYWQGCLDCAALTDGAAKVAPAKRLSENCAKGSV
jgi:hypothetical protein